MLQFRSLIESHLELLCMNKIIGDENGNLKQYFEELQVLRGMVHIWSHCKSIRDDENHWHPVEELLVQDPSKSMSHSICPSCSEALYPSLNLYSEDDLE